MAIEMLNYADLAARLTISPEAARALAKRLRLPRSRGNDGKALVSVDLAEINHAPLPARSPPGHQAVTRRSSPPSRQRSRHCRRRSHGWKLWRPVTGRISNASATARIA